MDFKNEGKHYKRCELKPVGYPSMDALVGEFEARAS